MANMQGAQADTVDAVWVGEEHNFNFGTGYKASADIKTYVIQLGVHTGYNIPNKAFLSNCY